LKNAHRAWLALARCLRAGGCSYRFLRNGQVGILMGVAKPQRPVITGCRWRPLAGVMRMKLEISEIIHRVGHQVTVDINEPCPADADFRCTAPIHGKLTLTNTSHHLLVRGDLATTVVAECARCLKEVLIPVKAQIEEEFPLPKIDARGAAHWEIEGEPSTIVEDYTLDTGELARQHLSLAVPMAPVCDDACQGLCPTCGKNLNEGPCECPVAEIDERLAGLRALLEESEEEGEE